jgi:effector-binding domain-containing protein
MFTKNCAIALTLSCLLLVACNSNDANKNKIETTTKDTAIKKDVVEEVKDKAPTINIFDTVSVAKIVVCMKDSAASIERVSLKLAAIYGSIGEHLAKVKSAANGQPMAWYKSDKAPYFFEAGLPVSKAPTNLSKGMYIKEIKADSATVAHFFGPYNLLSQGYTAIKERFREAKKVAKGTPYEIYVGDPIDKDGKAIDPYKVRTDIVFPWK